MTPETRIRYAVKNKVTGHIDLKYYALSRIEIFGLHNLLDVDNYEILARDLPIGMQDAKGQEIYTGDIYRHEDGSAHRYFVSIHSGACCGGEGSEYEPIGWDYDDDAIDMISETSTDWLILVGNIHQHPELLKDK